MFVNCLELCYNLDDSMISSRAKSPILGVFLAQVKNLNEQTSRIMLNKEWPSGIGAGNSKFSCPFC